MRLGYLLILTLVASPLVADPFSRVQVKKQVSTEMPVEVKAKAETEVKAEASETHTQEQEAVKKVVPLQQVPHKEVANTESMNKEQEVQHTEPQKSPETELAKTEVPQNGTNVALPETFFVNPETANAYSDLSTGDQKAAEEYFESYQFSERRMPTPYDSSPSLQERKRRVAQALVEQQNKAKMRAPKNPLAHDDRPDIVPQKPPAARTILNHE